MRKTTQTRSVQVVESNTAEEEAAIQRGIEEDPDNPEWTAKEIEDARPFPEVVAERRTDYRVEWSPEDKQYVGSCGGFPSLSWLDDTSETALAGIRKVVAETIAELLGDGEPIPPSHS
jgi:predicted RNase H-like HicB family nuclease